MSAYDVTASIALLALWFMVGATVALYVRERWLRRLAVLGGFCSVAVMMVVSAINRIDSAWNGGE